MSNGEISWYWNPVTIANGKDRYTLLAYILDVYEKHRDNH